MEYSFANGLNFYKLFWIFFIGSFIGVVTETIWCLIRLRKYESRKGLIYGPFNLVYGFGSIVMTVLLSFIQDSRDLYVFLGGSLIGGIFEYVCSLFQEKFLGSVSWDYKKLPFNLNGRVNLLYCFFWGLMSLVWIKDAYPFISSVVEMIPNAIGIPLTWILLVFMVLDAFVSAMAVFRMNERNKGIKRTSIFWYFFDIIYPDDRLKKIYPNMKFDGKITIFDSNST